MTGVVVALATVLLGVTALLAIPVSLAVRVERDARTRARWRARWLFGLVDVESGRAKPPRPKPERPRRKRGARRPSVMRLVAALRTRGFVRRVGRLLMDLVRRVRCDDFHLRAEYGFDDPADTGRVYGALAPLLVAAAASGLNVQCRPSFTRACLEGSCGATVRVTPLAIVASVVMFVFSPAVIRAMWALGVRR